MLDPVPPFYTDKRRMYFYGIQDPNHTGVSQGSELLQGVSGEW